MEKTTIDITPTWLGLLPAMIDLASNGQTLPARLTAMSELRKMAVLADALTAMVQHDNESGGIDSENFQRICRETLAKFQEEGSNV